MKSESSRQPGESQSRWQPSGHGDHPVAEGLCRVRDDTHDADGVVLDVLGRRCRQLSNHEAPRLHAAATDVLMALFREPVHRHFVLLFGIFVRYGV